MESIGNNNLRHGALFALFVTSYLPLFVYVAAKQIKDGWDYMHWGGWNWEAVWCCFSHFGMTIGIALVSIAGVVGMNVLLNNLKEDVKNGQQVRLIKINNRNSEAIGYIATYIVPFMASDMNDLFESVVFVGLMILIYFIYTNSNMILINPLLNIRYSLLEVEYKIAGDSQGDTHDALMITDNKRFRENEQYKIYPIGFKLYYGKERE